MIIANNQLTLEQQSALDSLCQAVQLIDHALPMIYSHLLSEPRQANSNLLYYEKIRSHTGLELCTWEINRFFKRLLFL